MLFACLQFIRANAHQGRQLWLTLGDLTALYLKRAEDAVTLVKTTQAILMAIALCTLTGVVLFLLPPSIRKVNNGRDATLHLFLSIPVIRVQEICDTKVELLAQMGYAAEAVGMDAPLRLNGRPLERNHTCTSSSNFFACHRPSYKR